MNLDKPGQPSTSAGNGSRLKQYFLSSFSIWTDLYERKDLYARIYQDRRTTAIAFIDDLNLPPASAALDIGCGPGLTTVALARKGYSVQAIDFLHEMAAATRHLSIDTGVQSQVGSSVGDACRLPFCNSAFDVIVIVGVTEWLDSPDELLSEVARVLKPNGYLVIAFNNKWGLQLICDPICNPLLAPLRRRTRILFDRWGWRKPRLPGSTYSVKSFETHLLKHRMVRLRARGVGFGPFSILLRNFLPDSVGHKLNSALQTLADRRLPMVRSTARIYVMLAQKN